MYKKSLIFEISALVLLALFALVGCPNPSSGTHGPTPPAAGSVVYPPSTVFMDDFSRFQNLLNAPSKETNDVTYIAYRGTIDDTVTVPGGKTVYLNGSPIKLNGNHHIIVSPGAKLVLESDVTTADDGRLLVNGTVEVYGKLTVTSTTANDPALQVAHYFYADGTINGRGTVIGTPQVSVMPSGTLSLTARDIANQSTTDRFTPAQAWAAAGQGNLEITGTLTPAYTVNLLLAGVGLPSADRTYTVSTQGGGVLPSLIPKGAIITADGVIEDADNHILTVNGSLTATNAASTFKDIETLTVNGKLIANAASFENVTTLVVSSVDSDGLANRASTAPSTVWNGSYLGADSATLERATKITIGDYGEFQSDSTAIHLPEGAKITLGRSAIFTSGGTTNNSFDNLTSLFIGPVSKVNIASPALTFKSLKTLTLQNSASLVAAEGNMVTFLVEATPSTPPKKTEVRLGLNVFYKVGVSPTAKVDVAVANDASIIKGSTIVLNEGSTLTVAAGKTLTVEGGASIDFRNLGTSAPASAEAAPIQINGAIELTGNGSLVGPHPSLFQANSPDIYKFIAFGAKGKVRLNHGTSYTFLVVPPAIPNPNPNPAHAPFPYIGSDPISAYRWSSANDGAQIILDAAGLTIRDDNSGNLAVITISGPGASIEKEHTLTLDPNVELRLTNDKGLLFAGDTGGGARLKGPGAVVAGTTRITGGSSGWRVFGSEPIGILQATPTTSSIENRGSGSSTVFRAMGQSAIIRQGVGSGNALTIAANTVVDLGGTSTSPGGSIVLKSGSNPGKLAFAGAVTAKVLLGVGTGGTAASGNLTTITIGGETVINNGLTTGDFVLLDRKLVELGGANRGAGNGINASNTVGNDVTIVSNAAFTNQ
ncbi:hypothetical protein LQZ21_09815 [Treponema sp. TIM-1]|uniref:hypothetical protein n=1 Tax=Treponema sp. TIM-1 TaxID=2898417 RepID=UPI00397FCF47